MAQTRWTLWEHDPLQQVERQRKYRAHLFRFRWHYTLFDVMVLFLWGSFVWRARAAWPLLLHVHPWMHLYSLNMLPLCVLILSSMLLGLCHMWWQIGQYRQEQERLEQQRHMYDAAHAPGVWPPPPETPVVTR